MHLKVPHDTPPLRGFQLHVFSVLQFRVSRSSNLLFHEPRFCPLLGPISPEWTPGLGSFLGKSCVDFSPSGIFHLTCPTLSSTQHPGRLIFHLPRLAYLYRSHPHWSRRVAASRSPKRFVVNLRWIRGGSLPSIFGCIFGAVFQSIFPFAIN